MDSIKVSFGKNVYHVTDGGDFTYGSIPLNIRGFLQVDASGVLCTLPNPHGTGMAIKHVKGGVVFGLYETEGNDE